MTTAHPDERTLRHYPGCFGCGSGNAHGLALDVRWDGDGAHAELVPPSHVEGAPGVAHGGYLSTLADEVMALVATEVAGEPTMTKRLALDLRTPVFTGRPLRLRAAVSERSGTRLTVDFEAFGGERERLCYSATGVFVTIPMKRWIRSIQAQGRGPEHADWSGDASNFLRWQMAGGLAAVFVAGELAAPVRIGVALGDVHPPGWTIVAGPEGIVARPGRDEDCDACFHGDFRPWQQLIHHTASIEQLLELGAASVSGATAALTRFVRAIDFIGATA